MDPEKLKFKDEGIIKDHNVDTENDHFCDEVKNDNFNPCKNANNAIKNSILISKEKQSINVFNNLIIPESDRYKSTAIALNFISQFSSL